MKERLKYFKVTDFKYGYNIIPNYPNLKLHISKHHTIQNNVIKLVFVGSVGIGRGLEEIIDLLNIKIKNYEIQLHIKGYLDFKYKKILMKLPITKEFLINDIKNYSVEIKKWCDNLCINYDIIIKYLKYNSNYKSKYSC